MFQVDTTIITAIIAAIVAVATAWTTAQLQIRNLKEQFKLEKEREIRRTRIHYLDPLIISANDFYLKIIKVIKQVELNKTNPQHNWVDGFNQMESKIGEGQDIFAEWCNREGAGAVTTLYLTCRYYARASKIREELPFMQLGKEDDQALLKYLNAVRNAFGGEFHIWVELQDSLGDYVTHPDGKIMNYRDFCTQLLEKRQQVWFTRLTDFYNSFAHDEKTTEDKEDFKSSLEELIKFASATIKQK